MEVSYIIYYMKEREAVQGAGMWVILAVVGMQHKPSIRLTRGSPPGFMTFAPEWLTGSPNLDTSNWMYL